MASVSKRGQWSDYSLKQAVSAVLQRGMSKKKAAKQYGIPRGTLQRHVRKAEKGYGVCKMFGRPTLLTGEQEEDLVKLILDMESRLYGLSPADVRRVVYTFCERNGIGNNFNLDGKMAGRKWLRLFMRRHPELSIRMPEKTSMQRAAGFNKVKVDLFFNILEKTLFDANGVRVIPPTHIYNVDESGFTICQKPQSIIARKGKKCVGVLTSAERGKNVTVVSCVSAHGVYVPPMFIFPRVRMKIELMDKTPTGSIGAASKTGWINESLFTQWFQHFLATVQPKARTEPTLLLADGHSSHTHNLEIIELARANNVILLVFPSHCTHKLQPLDVAVFKSINIFYDKAVATWLRQHPGRAVTEHDIGELYSSAYAQAATVGNAVNGFRKTGIHPFDPSVFRQEDFIAAEMTDRTLAPANGEPSVPGPSNAPDEPPVPGPSNAPRPSSPSMITFQDMFPTPTNVSGSGKRKRKCAHAQIITASPYKTDLKEMKRKKTEDTEAKNEMATKRRLQKETKPPVLKPRTAHNTGKGTRRTKEKVTVPTPAAKRGSCKRLFRPTGISIEDPIVKNTRRGGKGKEKMKSRKSGSAKSKRGCAPMSRPTGISDEHCKLCQFIYNQPDDPKSEEDWLGCSKCQSWFHFSCAEGYGILDDENFTCRECVE